MPRIRTYKPEFFRSPDTARASHKARLLYLAMWSWADDAGIGETNLYGLLGFAFPDEDEVTAAELQSLLKEVRGSYGVVFYGHRGRFYYYVPAFDKHQKTERRASGKYPKPDDPDSYPDLRFGASATIGGNSSPDVGSSGTGTGEQGNIGTGEPRNRGTDLVGATEVSHQGPNPVAPAEKCHRHLNDPNPPDCGGCASASREFKRWEREQRNAEALRAQNELEERRRVKAIRDNCPICHGSNWIPDTEPAVKCHHQEVANA